MTIYRVETKESKMEETHRSEVKIQIDDFEEIITLLTDAIDVLYNKLSIVLSPSIPPRQLVENDGASRNPSCELATILQDIKMKIQQQTERLEDINTRIEL